MSLLTIISFLLFFISLTFAHDHDSELGINPSGAEINVRFEEETPHLQVRGDVELEKRQTCGTGVGSCPSGQCCSSGGQCGTGQAFCAGPGCQLAYGPGCDGNTSPPGTTTANVPRPILGSVTYGGAGLYHCTEPGVIALTFDDGPYNFTTMVLATLAKYNVSATFFINGNSLGKGRIDDPTTPWPQILKNMYAAGHQLASHTWTHQDLTSLSADLMHNQVIYNEMAFRNIFGFFPTYLRPPYGYCSATSTCSSYLTSMGYHIIFWDIDTKDYLNDDPALIVNSENYFSGNTSNPANGHSYIPLAHDIHLNTALTLVTYMLDTLKARGYKVVTVGECMGDPRENWYRDGVTGGVPSSSTSTTSTSSGAPVKGAKGTGTGSTTSTTTSPSSTTVKALSVESGSATSSYMLSTTTSNPTSTAQVTCFSAPALIVSLVIVWPWIASTGGLF